MSSISYTQGKAKCPYFISKRGNGLFCEGHISKECRHTFVTEEECQWYIEKHCCSLIGQKQCLHYKMLTMVVNN